ncbi:acyl-CoA dehydrogenase family protein [Mycobacterium sp. SMC-8]|uniref:acyl-CoA dehydrogenase family protein n=1 Tax=Mycobacterium sp. SMC-8 TaxID=2857060 RepID=UPI0021B30282|nr:acyl-CoA dehydrogenase family protein [Mycobacterium sp. SMC-8]UXA11564.1 acyl-CoA dehydrogenase family protein [Mycobacterium sp. SMC-8]
MKLADSDLDSFRAELRKFIDDNAPSIPPRAGVRSAENESELHELRAWTQKLYSAGYAGIDWPQEWGGRTDRGPLHAIVVGEELARAQVPGVQGGGSLVAQALIAHGTVEQQNKFLPGISSGEDIWCQLFSEPEAGSDLASLRTKAVRDGDRYVISGQKVWTTDGHWARYGYLLARTDGDAPKHKGITAFLLDMSLPGIDIRPLREITGTSDFNEVYLDDVVVSADAVLGSPGEGWKIANASLAHERTSVSAVVVKLQAGVQALVDLAREVDVDGRPALESGWVRDRIGKLAADVGALAALTRANVDRWLGGAERPHDAAMAKLMFSEINVEIASLAVDMSGELGVLVDGDQDVLAAGRWQDEWLYSRAFTIAGGTSEIMRTMIAERGLALPRG